MFRNYEGLTWGKFCNKLQTHRQSIFESSGWWWKMEAQERKQRGYFERIKRKKQVNWSAG
jgi:hypothetical protein